MSDDVRSYLKRHTEALVKDVGVEAACAATGKSKATIGRYYSPHDEHRDRFMPVDSVALLERTASYPHVTIALAELAGLQVGRDGEGERAIRQSHVTEDIAQLSRRFAALMEAYAQAIADNVISPAEARRMLSETLELQKVLLDVKMNLERAAE